MNLVIIFIGLFIVALIVGIFLKQRIQISSSYHVWDFKYHLKNEIGLNANMIDFCIRILSYLQKENDIEIITKETMKQVLNWDHIAVLKEEDYYDVYVRNTELFDTLLFKLEYDTNVNLKEISEYIESWCQEARIADVVLTHIIFEVVNDYVNERTIF